MALGGVSEPAMRVVRLLVGREPMTVVELVELTGVSRSAVSEQLDELVKGGYVSLTVEHHAGPGRPRHSYQATNEALFLLMDSQDVASFTLGPAVWRAVRKVGGAALVEKVVDAVAAEMAEGYARRITATTPEKRLNQLVKLLAEEGLLVDFERKGKTVAIRKRSCTSIGLFEAGQSVCSIDQKVISLVVGRPVHRVACRHEGSPCCVFQLAPPEASR